MKPKTISTDRYNLIDAIRAAAIISMIAYHLCYDIFVVYGVDPSFYRYPLVILWERSICCTFIIISGISLNFSHHGYRRGIIVNLCGLIVTAVTLIFMPSEQIWFGVLNLIGCAMLLTYALRKPLSRLNAAAGMTVSLALFAFTYGVPSQWLGFFSIRLIPLPDGLYFSKYLAFLGFPSKDFFSADYFPLIPWVFLFVFGYFLWRCIKERNWDGVFRYNIPALSLIGRHSLLIYMTHQVVLYALCAAVFGHF